MKLSPLEIKKQEFDRSFRGYDVEEVQSFLQMVASQWESLMEQNRRLEEEVNELENKIEHYQKVEEALQDALDTARENAQQKMENAEEKAEHLVREAEQKAERIRTEAEEERYAIRREVSELKHRRQEIVTRLRAFLISEMEMLAQYEGDDPIGFIKFLPEGEDIEPRSSESPDEEMPSAREYLEARRDEGEGDEAADESSAGSRQDLADGVDGAGGEREELRRSEGPSEGEGAEEGKRADAGVDPDRRGEGSARPVGAEEERAERANSEEAEGEPRWRVHSVISEEEGDTPDESAESELADPGKRGAGRDPEQREEAPDAASAAESSATSEEAPGSRKTAGEEDPTEELSSEEMDKIRRILDDLE